MNMNQEMLSYYCGLLHSEWAQKKALAYLRILAEAEGSETEAEKRKEQGTGMRNEGDKFSQNGKE